MAVKTGLTRMGSKKNLSTVLTLQIHVLPRDGRFIETVGTLQPTR